MTPCDPKGDSATFNRNIYISFKYFITILKINPFMKLYYLAFRGDRQVQQLSHERKKKEKTKLENTSVRARSDSTFVPFWNVVGYQGSTPPYDSQGLRPPNHT
jgi:hypothetical protein